MLRKRTKTKRKTKDETGGSESEEMKTGSAMTTEEEIKGSCVRMRRERVGEI